MDKSKREFLKKGILGLGALGISIPFVNALQGINFSNSTFQSEASIAKLISRTVISGSPTQINLTGLDDDSEVDFIVIYISNLRPSSNADLYMRLGGASIDSGSNYKYGYNLTSSSGTGSDGGSTGNTRILLNHTNLSPSGSGVSGKITLAHTGMGASTKKWVTWQNMADDVTNGAQQVQGGAIWNNTTETIDKVRFFFSAGTETFSNGGIITVYGYKNQ